MPAAVRRGLYWSERTRAFHYEFKSGGVKRNGDTGRPTRALAQEFLTDLKARLARERAGLAEPRPLAAPTLAEALDKWTAAVRGSVTDGHVRKMRYVATRHFAAVLHTPLDKLSTARVDAIQAAYLAGERRGQGWKRPAPASRAAGTIPGATSTP
jgi:hypothetical protein